MKSAPDRRFTTVPVTQGAPFPSTVTGSPPVAVEGLMFGPIEVDPKRLYTGPFRWDAPPPPAPPPPPTEYEAAVARTLAIHQARLKAKEPGVPPAVASPPAGGSQTSDQLRRIVPSFRAFALGYLQGSLGPLAD
jgi:hypothetical protein